MRANKNISKNEGSSLLIALIIMSILLTLSVGVSNLLMGTMRDGRLLIEKTKAWYAAESGIETAMLKIADNPPGFEEQKDTELDVSTNYSYEIHATSSVVPKKEVYETPNESDKYANLSLSQSVIIPLFVGDKPENTVKKFRVDYYLAPELNLGGAHIYEDLDILRWKIFGIAPDGKMEIINEFVPLTGGNSASTPSCFGTGSSCPYWNASKFYQRMPSPDGFIEYNIVSPYPITSFLETHKQNFLVLTNMINIDLIAGAISKTDKKKIATIRYRVIDDEGLAQLTLPEIKISADGKVGDTTQSLDLSIKRDTFLPVFNYALYRTAE